jgi:hypothetical protein
MGGVFTRLAGGLIVLFAALSLTVPAWGQDEEDERAKAVDKVMRDYTDDGVIEACDHKRRALRDALKELPPEADIETPDLRPALEAAIEQVEADECEEEAEPTPTPTPAPTAAPAPTVAPAPPPPPPDDSGDDQLGTVTPLPPGDDGGNDEGFGTPGPDDVTPLDPEPTAVPPAATPAPAVPPPAEPSGEPPAPTYVNEDDPVPVSLLVLAGVLGLVALLALLYAVLSRLGWGERRLTGIRRAWDEARFRAGGTWGDFADWLRVGR